jgi:ribonuclease BN (tRNA processing enzyme)
MPVGENKFYKIHMRTKLTILGTGTFFVDQTRSSSAYLLEVGNKKILIDCGPGTLMRLSQVGVKPKEIDYVLITHFHADHTSDLFPLFMNFRLNAFFSKGKSMKFPQIIGPKGVGKFMLKSSQNFELLSVQGWNKINFINIKKLQKIANVKLEAFKVKHVAFGLATDSYAYRFTINKKVVAFSGDSAKCSGIEKACKHADIFICDASYSKGNGNSAHFDTRDIGIISEKGQVKKVILSHFYPQTDKIDLIKEVKEKFSGKAIRGKDLMIIDI